MRNLAIRKKFPVNQRAPARAMRISHMRPQLSLRGISRIAHNRSLRSRWRAACDAFMRTFRAQPIHFPAIPSIEVEEGQDILAYLVMGKTMLPIYSEETCIVKDSDGLRSTKQTTQNGHLLVSITPSLKDSCFHLKQEQHVTNLNHGYELELDGKVFRLCSSSVDLWFASERSIAHAQA